jgi:hypothetical protein
MTKADFENFLSVNGKDSEDLVGNDADLLKAARDAWRRQVFLSDDDEGLSNLPYEDCRNVVKFIY